MIETGINKTRLQAQFDAVVAGGLTMEPRFAEIADHWERWWRFDADRPLLVGTAPKVRGARWTKPFDLLEAPQRWLAASRAHLAATHFLDHSIPHIRVDFGPLVTAAFLGTELHFALNENTSWQLPVADVYVQSLTIDPQNRWFRACVALAEITARDARGSYLVSLPDLGSATDLLANLRGSEQLLTDLYDRPADVARVLPPLVDAWETTFATLVGTIAAQGAGVTSWLHAWSAAPYTVPSCDFNAMIGPDHFAQFALPYLEDQKRRAGRCLFHLDGNDASRHAPALAASSIDAIQYTPGAGSTGAVAKIPMFRMLQDAGKPLLVIVEAHEVPQLLKALDPRGTVLFVEGIADQAAALELEELVR